MKRTFVAHSPLGEQLEFRSMEGTEQMSRLFEFRVRLISQNSSISAKSLLGKDMSIEVDLTTEKGGGGKRFISGQVTQFTYIGRDGDFYLYESILRPWLWHATRRSDFKIFQFRKAPDIIKEVLGKYGFSIEDKLTGSYREWPYIVQYGESDFNFISRLLELEGGYYYFSHSMGSHTLVLADDIGSHSPLPNGPSTIAYYPESRAAHVHDEDFIDGWAFAEDIASGNFAADDYDFEKPKAILDTRQQQPAGHSEDSREQYEWPGGYTESGDGENYARIRIEQQKAQREIAQGEGNARNIAPGYLFTFSKYPRGDQNKEYLIESAHYRFEENVRRSDGAGGSGAAKRGGIDSGTTYRISFAVMPKSTAYRSQRATPKPHTTGPQTAVITGPAGEEIYTDKYGRVKVQFHWDRYGSFDENSSCWIRVSQTWAGSNYGSMHIPRIGQEVIVDFLNGDPDYPIITGRVYNAMQMPPWELPKHKTQSGTQTNWSKGGGGKNMLRFEDQKGIEHLELSSDHGNTHLHMGYLMNQGTEAKRSYGFELRTNEWGAIRADKGLLITTYTQDFKNKITHDNPDGFEHLGEHLADSKTLMQEASSAVSAMDAVISSLNEVKKEHMSELASGILSMVGQAAAKTSLGGMAAAMQAFAAAGSKSGTGPEMQMPLNTDPALPGANDLHARSKDINKPIVSIVSPEGHSMISPKPVVISSGQSVTMRGTGSVTVSSTQDQLSLLAKAGMLTHVTAGGQRTTVTGGDIAHDAQTGNFNLTAKERITMASTNNDASVLAKQNVNIRANDDSVLIKAGQHIRLEAGNSITLVVGKGAASLTLKDTGEIEIVGKKSGLISFTEQLDERAGKILLNCATPVTVAIQEEGGGGGGAAG
ncbi:type VI secretion system Vgr family protein [Comamonas sp. 4034]|uniref:type VI secretion system Vgr family protein n=1 Tax=Comamonas sp. 4034 TaxID=3156455 RepID=UPI003D1CD07D